MVDRVEGGDGVGVDIGVVIGVVAGSVVGNWGVEVGAEVGVSVTQVVVSPRGIIKLSRSSFAFGQTQPQTK
jgi:hypothetical protein